MCTGGEEGSVYRRRGGERVREERRGGCMGGEEGSVDRRRGGECIWEERRGV